MDYIGMYIFAAFWVVVIVIKFRHLLKVDREEKVKRERGK